MIALSFVCACTCAIAVTGELLNGNSAPPINSYGTPNYNTATYAQDINNLHSGSHDEGYGEPKSYEFGYQVKDDYTGTNYKRQEVSNGHQVQGEYRVQLPDGRTQIVTYWADWQTGFHADVRYEGEASYPETYATNNHHQQQQNHQGGYGVGNPATSAVSIKDYSGPATPYNYNQHAPSDSYGVPYK